VFVSPAKFIHLIFGKVFEGTIGLYHCRKIKKAPSAGKKADALGLRLANR